MQLSVRVSKVVKSMLSYLHRIELRRPAGKGWVRGVYFGRLLLFLVSVAVLSPHVGFAQGEPDEDGGPLLFSVFPTAGQQGSTIKAEARGIRLDGAYSVWFDGGRFEGRILRRCK